MQSTNKFRQERNRREDEKRAERFAVSEVEHRARLNAEYARLLADSELDHATIIRRMDDMDSVYHR